MASGVVDRINSLNATQKLIISLILGGIAYFVLPFTDIKILPHLLFSWDIFSLSQLVLAWVTFYSTPPKEIRKQSRKQDDNGVIIFFIILIATCTSMLAVILLLISQTEDTGTKAFRLAIAIGCMLFSWFLVHTIFTIRYAHLYYADNRAKKETYAGGLHFPDDREPDFLDFAYFSFTAGMTFQVSDVEISSKKIRRLTLLHSLISFGYNATIIALSVNIIGGLTQG